MQIIAICSYKLRKGTQKSSSGCVIRFLRSLNDQRLDNKSLIFWHKLKFPDSHVYVMHLSVARWRKALFYNTSLSLMYALHNAIMGFFDNDISDILKLDGSHVQS